MHPILFKFPESLPLIGGFKLHVYGLMIALGFLFGMWFAKKESRRLNINEDHIMDIFFYTLVAGLVGSRILYVIHSVPDFWSDPAVVFRVWEGGLVFQGGVIGAILMMWAAGRKYKIKFFQIADIFAPGLSMGHAMGRIGCFFAGCCHGKQCDPDFMFAVIFPRIEDGIAPAGIPLYPTQLFETFGEIIIFILLVTYRKKAKFVGAVFLLYLILYSILRSGLETIRGDTVRGFVVEPYLSNGQFIALIMIVFSLFFWAILSKKAKEEGSN